MVTKFTYLLINAGTILVPFLFSFHPSISFRSRWKFFWPANLISALLFVLWDMLYTRLGVWGFNDRYLTGLKIVNLPVEEVLFFVCIPYASVFTYHCFRNFFPRIANRSSRYVSLVLIAVLAVTGLCSMPKLYTSVTFMLLTALILLLDYGLKAKWLSHFYFSYLVILLPFFVVNGILTGTGLEEPVVWYNNAENLGWRISTIPVEDIFYGMLLLLLNTALYEFRSGKKG